MSTRKELEDGTEKGGESLGTFEGSNTTEIGYLRRGVEVTFHVEGDFEKAERNGVAAVLVVGIMYSANHGKQLVEIESKDATLKARHEHPAIEDLGDLGAESDEERPAETSGGAMSKVSTSLL